MEDIYICAHCGSIRDSRDMIAVEPTDNEDSRLWFCTWNCVGDYAISTAIQDTD
jgi:hypothetical protein